MEALLRDPAVCDVIKLEQALETKSHKLEYEKSAGRSRVVLQDEDTRRARVGLLLLEEENYALREELADEHAQATDLEMQLVNLRVEQSLATDTVKQLQEALRAKSKQTEMLQAEVTALSTVSTKSTKVLTEKLALAHELASLKPELEHLRKEASLYQATLSEKLTLQREVNTLEVELENQKRTTQRAMTKQQEELNQDMKFEVQVAKLRKELAREKEDREQAEREAQQALEDEQGKSAALETKLAATKEKLRTFKAALKEREAELQQPRASEAAAEAARAVAAAETEKPKRRARKRKAPEPDLENLGTPNNDGAISRALANKREKRVSTMPGDKSTFSITPFLNRTTSLAPDSPPKGPTEEAIAEAGTPCAQVQQPPAPAETAAVAAEPGAKKAKRATKATRQSDDDADAPKKRATKGKSKTAEPKKRLAAPPLSQVVEENEETEAAAAAAAETAQEPAAVARNPKPAAPSSNASTAATSENRTKKRKLLGSGATKTLFDDDNNNEVGPVRALGKSAFGSGNGLPVLSRSLAGRSAGLTLAFSPLKKDRRAAGSVSGLQ